jgi:hypothetical protein
VSEPTPPTCDQLLDDDGCKEVHREDDASWRHGVYRFTVHHRASDDTYWGASYCVSTDGETHELREGMALGIDCPVCKVSPHFWCFWPSDEHEDVPGNDPHRERVDAAREMLRADLRVLLEG